MSEISNSSPSLPERIDGIIDRRIGRNGHVGRLPVILGKRKFFMNLHRVVEDFQALRTTILSQIDEERGQYYVLSQDDPQFREKVECADTAAVLAEIEKSLAECDRLEKRFNRESINISVIGLAGQGKSTLLQSIGNLSNSIIPAADGTDCTGAKSVICNTDADNTTAKIIFYNEAEMLEQIQRYIDALELPIRLYRLDQLPGLLQTFEQPEFKVKIEEKRRTAAGHKHYKHLCDYINHYADFGGKVGQTEVINDESRIRDYVAQYREDGTPTYYYLAVKEAQIFTRFAYREAGKIVLVDTIGLGDTALGIENKLISTLRNDSDAAILLRRPRDGRETADFRQEDLQLFSILERTIGSEQLRKWLFVAINGSDALRTTDYCRALKSRLDNGNYNYAFSEVVDCANPAAVTSSLLIPMLEHLAANLDDVDNELMQSANTIFADCHRLYAEFCNNASKILENKLREVLDMGDMFDRLYEALSLGQKLKDLNLEYGDHNRICTDIETEMQSVLGEIRKCCPEEKTLKDELDAGTRNSHAAIVYSKAADTTRAAICDKFDEINRVTVVRLQDEMKERVINVLRGQDGGNLGAIELDGAAADAPAQEWLAAFIVEKLDRFPIIKNAFQSILDYKLSIESLLDYQLNKCLSFLDVDGPDFTQITFPTNDAKANAFIIRQNIMTTIPVMAKSLLKNSADIMKVPFNSFFARVRKLREQILYDMEGERQLKSLYRRYATQVWASEIKVVRAQNDAIDTIEEAIEKLNANRALNLFTIKLK